MQPIFARADHAPQDPQIERRQHRRHRVMLSARIHSAAGASTAVLLDISEGGALVACPAPLPRGAHVVLVRGAMQAAATVVHVDGRRLGLLFDAPLDPATVADVVTPLARWVH